MIACTNSCKHQIITVYGSLPILTVNFHTLLIAGRWKMALRRVIYEGIYVGSAGGIANIECDALSSTIINNGVQSGGDECINFTPPVLVFKPFIADCSFDELRFTLAVILGREVLVSAIGAVTVEFCPVCCD